MTANRQPAKRRRNVIIMGAAGRDFHNFNVFYRANPAYNVVCFTAEQIPDIAGRKYPKALAGKLYPHGIPIYPEQQLAALIRKHDADDVVFAYSDVSHQYVMHRASIALAHGASFVLLGPKDTMLKSSRPVISVCAIRTGSGKSQTTRYIASYLKAKGRKVAVIRHPMPYGELAQQAVQRFADYRDLEKHDCTIEEREEYEPHIEKGIIVYAGVDYERILRQAEQEADAIIWDGGNNDLPFYRPDLHIVVADPHRASHSLKYHPGEANLRMADIVLINKVDSAHGDEVARLKSYVNGANPKATVMRASSPITVEGPETIRGKRVLVLEDGPTVTHGGMDFGAGLLAARKYGCTAIDPRPYAAGSIKATYRKYPHLEKILPAMGYGAAQVQELSKTINAARCQAVIIGTPIDLRRLVRINKPAVRVRYDLKPLDKGVLENKIESVFLRKR